jgi:uncharacterized OB-fold protein
MPFKPYAANRLEASKITVTEKIQQQQRFFCDNCGREVFLLAKYCDKCGGKIEWPEKIQKVLASWQKETKKRK